MNTIPIKGLLRGILGGVAGGVLGGLACKLLADQGLYAVAIPGGLVGIGFSLAARGRHLVYGLVAGVLGLLAGLLTQWQVYSNQPSFIDLVLDLKNYHMATWILIAVGTVMAFAIGLGRPARLAGPTSRSDDSNL